MAQQNGKLPGMHIPCIFLWLLGAFHGKVLKTAAIDPDTGCISSGYVEGKIRLFQGLCAGTAAQLERDLKAAWTEAADLAAEEALLDRQLAGIPVPRAAATVEERRQAKRSRSRRDALDARRLALLKRLIELDHKIRSRELETRAHLDRTVQILQSRLAAYGHGALLSPFYQKYIPPVNYAPAFAAYEQAYRQDRDRLSRILEEVYDHA